MAEAAANGAAARACLTRASALPRSVRTVTGIDAVTHGFRSRLPRLFGRTNPHAAATVRPNRAGLDARRRSTRRNAQRSAALGWRAVLYSRPAEFSIFEHPSLVLHVCELISRRVRAAAWWRLCAAPVSHPCSLGSNRAESSPQWIVRAGDSVHRADGVLPSGGVAGDVGAVRPGGRGVGQARGGDEDREVSPGAAVAAGAGGAGRRTKGEPQRTGVPGYPEKMGQPLARS